MNLIDTLLNEARPTISLSHRAQKECEKSARSLLRRSLDGQSIDEAIGDECVEIANKLSRYISDDAGAYEDFMSDVNVWLRSHFAKVVVNEGT